METKRVAVETIQTVEVLCARGQMTAAELHRHRRSLLAHLPSSQLHAKIHPFCMSDLILVVRANPLRALRESLTAAKGGAEEEETPFARRARFERT